MAKTTQIKVPANLGPLGNIILFPGYLSNGQWAIKKTRLSNADLLATQASAEAYFTKRYTVRERVYPTRPLSASIARLMHPNSTRQRATWRAIAEARFGFLSTPQRAHLCSSIVRI